MTEESLFSAALEIADPAARLAFLKEACGGDAGLLERLQALLAAHEQAAGILDGGGAFQPQPVTSPESPGLEVGAVIGGRYKVLESLGEGGMGTVYVAEQTEPVRRKVALKVVKTGLDSQRVLARFEAERQALALMDHPHIAKVLDGGLTEAGRPYFVMEYIKGVPLTDYCDSARLTVRQRLELFVPVCQAVQHAHQKGIIHRDLKPSNILVALYDGKPMPKVIDFGLAKAIHQPLTERTVYTAHEAVMGTPLYMSPEQAELNNLDVDTRTDVYSLGVILYELLTGETPLERGRLRKAAWDEILRVIREEEPPRPSTRLSGSARLPALAAQRQLEPAKLARLLRGDLDWVVMKALEKDRGRRYETANGFALDVQRYLAEEPVLAGPPTAAYRLRKFVRRNRGPVLAAAALLLALLVGTAGTAWGLVRALRAEAAARAAEAQAVLDRDMAEEALLAKGQALAAEAEQRKEADERRREAEKQQKRAEQAEREAKEQAAVTQAVNDFLQKDLLGQADVGNQPLLAGGAVERDPNVTVRELLNRAALGIEGKFAGQPLTEAAIRLTIGDVLRALGRHEESGHHLERSIRLRTAQLGADHPDTLTSKNALALLYHSQGQYAKAETLHKEVLEARAAKLGAGHRDTLVSKNNLALLYMDQGQYGRAEPLLKEVLEVNTARLGAGHRHTLACKNNLAALYEAQGRYGKAEPLYKEALEGQTARLGADHPDTLAGKANLAGLYKAQGQYARAETLFKEALEVSTARLGADHSRTLASKGNLAALYLDQREYARAEPLLKEVLEVRTARLGADHPDTLTSKNNLAGLYLEQGQYARAEPLYKEVLEGCTARLGADHPRTLASKANLAALYKARGQYARAETLLKEALEVSTARLGADHPSTLISKNNLAALYRLQGQYVRAEPLYKEVLEGCTARLGADHPRTLASKANLAGLYLEQGQYARAEPLYKEVLEGCTARLGADHPHTLASKANLAALYKARRQYGRAEPLLKEVLEVCTARLGAGHPDTLTSKANLAALYRAQGQYARAEPLYKEALEGRIARLGADHPRTLACKNGLAGLYIAQGQYGKAEPLYKEALEGQTARLGADHPDTLAGKANLAGLYLAQGQYARAEPLARELAESWKKRAGADSAPFAVHLGSLGFILLKQQKASQAEPVLRACLVIREKREPDAWPIFNTRSQLGGALLGQQKYADAEPLLLQGYEGMKQREAKIPPPGKVRLTEALERLVQLYEATGQKDKAEEWRKKLELTRPAKPLARP
jgi:tetratricopeptide (TPR) repeat protein/predicted Ser/Thr protein kinase